MLIEINKSLSEMNARLAANEVKVDRLVSDVASHGSKIDGARLTLARWTGVIAILAFALPVVGKFAGDWIVKVMAH